MCLRLHISELLSDYCNNASPDQHGGKQLHEFGGNFLNRGPHTGVHGAPLPTPMCHNSGVCVSTAPNSTFSWTQTVGEPVKLLPPRHLAPPQYACACVCVCAWSLAVKLQPATHSGKNYQKAPRRRRRRLVPGSPVCTSPPPKRHNRTRLFSARLKHGFWRHVISARRRLGGDLGPRCPRAFRRGQRQPHAMNKFQPTQRAFRSNAPRQMRVRETPRNRRGIRQHYHRTLWTCNFTSS